MTAVLTIKVEEMQARAVLRPACKKRVQLCENVIVAEHARASTGTPAVAADKTERALSGREAARAAAHAEGSPKLSARLISSKSSWLMASEQRAWRISELPHLYGTGGCDNNERRRAVTRLGHKAAARRKFGMRSISINSQTL